MKKYIISFTVLLSSFSVFGQDSIEEKIILFDNDSLMLVNHYDIIHQSGSTLCLFDKKTNKIDTLGIPNGFPIRKSFFNGKYFTTFYQHDMVRHIVYYSLFAKVDNKWQIVSYHGGVCIPSQGKTYSLDQIDIFTLIENATGGYYSEDRDITSEYKFDVEKEIMIRYRILPNGSKEKMDEYPFLTNTKRN